MRTIETKEKFGGLMEKQLKAKTKKEKSKFAIWKVVVATLCSVLGAIGIIFLGLYFSGSFSRDPVNPEGLFFADVTINEKGEKTYTSRGATPYNISADSDILISTATQGVNQNQIELSFPKGSSSYFVLKLNNGETEEDFAGSNTKFFYSKDADGNRVVYVSCIAEKATHITNGVIIVPRYVTLNTKFKVILAQEDEEGRTDFTKTFSPAAKLYNVGGYTQLIAKSVSSKLTGSVSVDFNIDVPVESISIVGITGNSLSKDSVAGLNEQKLTFNGDQIEVGTEGAFSAVLNVFPFRAIYKYGKDGTKGVKEYKKVIFSLDADVNNSGPKITFADNSGNEVADVYLQEGRMFTFAGKETLGTSLLAKKITGQFNLEAKMFKSAKLEDEALKSGIGQLGDFNSVLSDPTKGLSTKQSFLIKEIPIEGFGISDEYKGEIGDDDPTKNPLTIDINNSTLIYANKPGDKSLGIKIESSQGVGQNQNKIKNILVSIQYLIGEVWYDATKTNIVGEYTIMPMYQFHVDHEIVTQNGLSISETNSLYYFNFIRPKYISASNLSYWEVWATPVAEDIEVYGISAVAIKVYYLSPDSGLVLDDAEHYGPYGIGSGASEVVQPQVEWKENDELKTSRDLGLADYNERVFVKNTVEYAKYNKISLRNLQNITNISSNPTYKTIRYFVYTNQKVGTEYVNLEQYLNVKKYNGTIPGVSGAVFEIEPTDDELLITSLDLDYIEFNLIFAVVEHEKSGTPTLHDGKYRIITVPTEVTSGNLITCPIRIYKTLGDFEITVAESKLKPYGDSDKRNFFMQNQEKVISLEITINKNDDTLFQSLAKKGDIKLIDSADIYCKIASREVALSEVLGLIFSAENPEITYVDILDKNEVGEKIVYSIKLSTKSLNFDADSAEKSERLSLEYKISASNMAEADKLQTKSTEFYVYSGKIINAYFGTEGNKVTNAVTVNKTIKSGKFETEIKNDIAIGHDEDGYFLNVYVEGFGFADSYTVTSSNSCVVLTWIASKSRYSISFVGEGTSTLTLTLAYPHKDFTQKTLEIGVSSSYTTKAEYNANSSVDDRILSYNSVVGYQILGLANETTIRLEDLIKITAIPNGSETGTDITELFNFSLSYDDPNDFKNKVEIIKESEKIVGIKIKNSFGSSANIIVSVSSVEIGVTFQFNILVKPNVELRGTSASHAGLSSTEPDTYAVYCEADISFVNFGLYVFDLATKTYSTASSNPLHFALYKDGKLVENIEKCATLTQTGNILNKLSFKPGSGNYTLVVSDVEKPGIFDLKKEFKFVVHSNVKLDQNPGTETKKENISYINSSNEEIVLENVDVYNLNNEILPILNGQSIRIVGNKIVFGNTGIEINISRIFGDHAFDSGLLKINEKETEKVVVIKNVKSLSKQILRVSYGDDVTMYVSYYVAPNITLASDYTVTYDGKTYVKLYCGQVITNATSWFKHNGDVESFTINFGSIASGRIDSLPAIYSKVGSVNLTENGTQYFVNKTSDGLIITQIVVSYDTGENREYRVFDALISPIDFDNFVTYNGSETGADWKEILAGTFVKEITSGETKEVESFLKNVNNYFGKTGSTLNYRLLRETATGFIELSGGVAGIRRENGILKFITQPVASDSSYRIKFEYIVKSESYDDACFTFYYYIKVIKNQSIEIFYPYGSGGTTLENNAPTDSEKELFPDMTISESFETLRKHIVYFDQFLGGNYIFDLTESANNFNSNFVEVLVGGKMQQQNTDTPSYNKLRFSIYKIFVNGVETSASAFDDYITVSDSGVVTLKKPTQTVLIMIKVSTDNGAENYYRLVVRERPSNVNVKHGTTTYTSDLVDSELAITNGFELSNLIINSAVGEVNYKIVNDNGKEQTSENMIYIKDGKIVVESSPNSQSAYLVIYNEEFGTVAKIKVVAKSPIVVEFKQTKDIYSDRTIDLSTLLTITVNGTGIPNLSGLNYSIKLDGKYGFVETPVSGCNLLIHPIANEKTVQLTIKVWGEEEVLPGTNETNPCVVSCALNVKPRVSPKQDVSKDITAGGETTISLSDLFGIQKQDGITIENGYNIEMSYVWDGDVENETLMLSHEGPTTTFKDNITINVSNISTKRTARLTIKVYKKDGDNNVLGEVITATCTLTINPKYTVTINYPDHGTGNNNLTAEAIYVNYKEEIDLLKRITFTGGDTKLTFVSSNTDLIEIVDGKTGVIKIKEGASVEFNTRVFVNIYVAASELNDGKYIGLGVYTIIVSPNEIKSAEYGINGSGVTYRRDTLVNTALSENENFFDVKDGWLKLETKNSTQDNFFKFTLSVREKFDHFKVPTGIKDVVIYGAGTESAGYPLLFTLNTNDGGIKSEKVLSAPTEIVKVEVLGDEPTADVCKLSEGKLTFNKAGTWIIRLTTSSETFVYLFNSEHKNGTYEASCYKPISTDDLNRLMFESIFGTNLTNKDMYDFVIDSSTVVNVGIIKDFGLTQPETLLNFYYNLGEESYKIPYSTASELYTYSVGDVDGEKKKLSEFKLEDLNPKDETTLIIFNEQGREVARYVYSIANDFAFDEDAITEYEKTGISGSFEENEFEDYAGKIEVSKTIELTAGTRYDLINLLKNNLGLRTFDGGEFVVENIKGKFTISLGYSKFTTNSNFKSNISALVGIVSTGDNTYEIIPHGARNNGDIVHLVLTIGGRKIILRINIVPIAKIQTLSSTGEKVISSAEKGETKIALSQLITASNVDVSKLQVAIVAGLSDGYAVSTGSSNYLTDLKTDDTQVSGLDRYGIKFKKTALGGAVLKFRIFDEFGYEVADSTGTPIQIKINYRNSSGKIVEVDKYNSASSIYEGDSFDIWAKVENEKKSTAYYKWDSENKSFGEPVEYKPSEMKETIMLENISDENINGISVELDYSASFKTDTGAGKMDNFGVGYFSNTKFGLSQQIAGDNFVITIKYEEKDESGTITWNETTGITTNTTVQQRYILRFKNDYNSYNEIYIGYAKGSKNPKNYLEVYDKKAGEIANKVFFSIENSSSLIERPEGEFVNKYWVSEEGKTRFGHEVTYKLIDNKDILSEGNSYSLYYCIVMDIMSMEIGSVGSYGAIIDGKAGGLLLDEDDIKKASIKFKDFYGNKVDEVDKEFFWTPDPDHKELEYYDTSILGTELQGGETVYVKIYGVYEQGKQGENTLLGIVPITRAKYYALGGGGSTGISSSSLTIPFKDAHGNGWGKHVKAVITGNLGEDELQASLGGQFEYKIKQGSGKILYDEALNCYTIVLNNPPTASDLFTVEVRFMGKELGSFNITVEDGKWASYASDCLLEVDSNIVNGSIYLKKFAKANEEITVTVTPNVEFKFKCLIVNGKVLSDGEKTFNVESNSKIVVSAKFERIKYSITKENVNHASINLSKIKAYYGDTITVSVTPDEGYRVSAIKVNGVKISGNSFVVREDSVVTVKLTASYYSITVNPSENGSIVPDKTPANVGETIRLSVSPSEGYNIANLEIKSDGKDVARVINGNTVTFTMPAGNVTISATFAQNVNEVKINPTENGNVFATPVNALEGAEVVLTVSPATGYKLKSLKVMFGETEISVVDNKFTMPAGEVTISATFEKINYTITREGTTNGSFTVSKITANYNDEITITATPKTGYEIDQILVDGNPITETTFMMPAKDVAVKVTFKKIVYNLSLISVSPEAGTAEIESNTAYYGNKIKISVTLETEYEIKNILINNEVGTGSWTQSGNKLVYEITMPNEDVVIMINIDKKSYKISTVNSDGGNITVSQTTACYKDSILIEVSLKTGYRLSQITVKDAGGNSIEVNDNSFIMPASDVTISVKYEKNNYNISGSISGDGNYIITNKSYNYQDTITITGTPNKGYYFNDVIVKCGSSTFHATRTSETTFDFIMPGGDVTIAVVFGLKYVLGLCDVDINMAGVLTNVKSSKTSYIMPSKFYSLNNEIEYTIGDGEKCIDSDVVSIEISDGVTTINKAAFSGCTGLTSITIPSSVTSIGDSAFSGCTSLKMFTVPNGVTKISNSMFDGCKSLETIAPMENITSIGEFAFRNCEKLIRISLPEGIKVIERYTFYGCSSLSSIRLPSSLETIQTFAFAYTGLTSIVIPNKVIALGAEEIDKQSGCVFKGCTLLTSVTLPDTFEDLGVFNFERCTALECLVLPKTLKSLNISSINSIKALVMLGTTAPTLSGTSMLYPEVYVPSSALSGYRAANKWKEYASKIHANLANLIDAPRSFDGTEYVNLGRGYMYQDKITVEVRAYMDDWSKYTTNMRLISCTEGGGWNVGEVLGGKIHFACYDSGNGYKNVTTSMTFADLSAGWHTFKITFDGEYLRAYIDGESVGTSEKYVSGKIGYASNSIFVGAEAGSSTTTPIFSSGNFKGIIAYIRIENNVS